jgi:hypothetical protein
MQLTHSTSGNSSPLHNPGLFPQSEEEKHEGKEEKKCNTWDRVPTWTSESFQGNHQFVLVKNVLDIALNTLQFPTNRNQVTAWGENSLVWTGGSHSSPICLSGVPCLHTTMRMQLQGLSEHYFSVFLHLFLNIQKSPTVLGAMDGAHEVMQPSHPTSSLSELRRVPGGGWGQ